MQQEEAFPAVRAEDERRVVRLLRAPGHVVTEAESLGVELRRRVDIIDGEVIGEITRSGRVIARLIPVSPAEGR